MVLCIHDWDNNFRFGFLTLHVYFWSTECEVLPTQPVLCPGSIPKSLFSQIGSVLHHVIIAQFLAIMETVSFTMDRKYSSTVWGIVLRGNEISLSKYVQVVAAVMVRWRSYRWDCVLWIPPHLMAQYLVSSDASLYSDTITI